MKKSEYQAELDEYAASLIKKGIVGEEQCRLLLKKETRLRFQKSAGDPPQAKPIIPPDILSEKVTLEKKQRSRCPKYRTVDPKDATDEETAAGMLHEPVYEMSFLVQSGNLEIVRVSSYKHMISLASVNAEIERRAKKWK